MADTYTFNRELASEILELILENPEQHNQGSWEVLDSYCGTTRCIAGWAIYLHMQKTPEKFQGCTDISELKDRYIANLTPEEAFDMGAVHWGALDYADVAGHILGLPPQIGTALFFEMDDLVAVQNLSYLVAGRVPENWRYELGYQSHTLYQEMLSR